MNKAKFFRKWVERYTDPSVQLYSGKLRTRLDWILAYEYDPINRIGKMGDEFALTALEVLDEG